MLETAAHAQARNVRPLAEILGLASGMAKALSPDDIDEIISAAMNEAGISPGQVCGVCHYGVPETLPPAWRAKRVQAVAATGLLEGAQPLVDLAAALHSPELSAGAHVLSLAVTSHGQAGAAVFKKL
jgi:hypothetical protein